MHIVRHPGGFLNSWRNRYLRNSDPAAVLRANRERLKLVAIDDPAYAGRMGDIDAMGADEAELWFWRYASEVVERAGSGKPMYKSLVYEDLVSDVCNIGRDIYDFCGLDWTPAVARRIQSMALDSRHIARAWRERLDAEDVALIERVLGESPLKAKWVDA